MNTTALAAGIAGFLLGGLLASTAASLSEDEPAHSAGTVVTTPAGSGHG